MEGIIAVWFVLMVPTPECVGRFQAAQLPPPGLQVRVLPEGATPLSAEERACYNVRSGRLLLDTLYARVAELPVVESTGTAKAKGKR